MTTPQNEPDPAPKNLRQTRKEARAKNNVTSMAGRTAKKAPAKAPAKKVAKKAPAAKKEPAAKVLRDPEHPWYARPSYAPLAGHKLYEATGDSGQISVRSSEKPLTHAISWGDPDRAGERAFALRAGVIHDFFTDEESAQKVAKARQERNPHHKITVVPCREYKGQSGDKK